MNMSFYGGKKGQDLLAKQIFNSCSEMLQDLVKNLTSDIEIGEYVAISYGSTENDEYYSNRQKDAAIKCIGYYNGSFWEKNQKAWTVEYPTSKYYYKDFSLSNDIVLKSISKGEDTYPLAYYFEGTNIGYERKLDLGTLPSFTVAQGFQDTSITVPAVEIGYSDNDKTQPVIKFEFPDLYFDNRDLSDIKPGDYKFNSTTGVLSKYEGSNKADTIVGTLIVAPQINEIESINPYDEQGNPVSPQVEIDKSTSPWGFKFKLPSIPKISAQKSTQEKIANVTTERKNDEVIFSFSFDLSNLESLKLQPSQGYHYDLEGSIESTDAWTTITQELNNQFGGLEVGNLIALSIASIEDGVEYQHQFWAFISEKKEKENSIENVWVFIPIESLKSETFVWKPFNGIEENTVYYEGGNISSLNKIIVSADAGEVVV